MNMPFRIWQTVMGLFIFVGHYFTLGLKQNSVFYFVMKCDKIRNHLCTEIVP